MTEPCEKRNKRIWERIAEVQKYLDEIALPEGINVDTYKLAEELANPNTSTHIEHEDVVEKILSGEELSEEELDKLRTLLLERSQREREAHLPSLEELPIKPIKASPRQNETQIVGGYYLTEVDLQKLLVEATKKLKEKARFYPSTQTTLYAFSPEKVDIEDIKKHIDSVGRELEKAGLSYEEVVQHLPKVMLEIWVERKTDTLERLKQFAKLRKEIMKYGWQKEEAHKHAQEITKLREEGKWGLANKKLEELKKKARRKKPI